MGVDVKEVIVFIDYFAPGRKADGPIGTTYRGGIVVAVANGSG